MSSTSKDRLMKNLFKFPQEALAFVKEVARINEDIKLEEVVNRLLSDASITYKMFTLNEEKEDSIDSNKYKRLDLALEFVSDTENLEFIIFIENQTTNDRAMPLRMLEYITATMLEKLKANHYNIDRGLPRPIPILIYIGRDNLAMPVQMGDYFKTPAIANVGVDFKAHLVDLGGKDFCQIMDNTNTPSIFLQLMKAIYTGDQDAFHRQRQALYDNLSQQIPEVSNHYQRLTGLLATDFLDLFLETTIIDEEEVNKMANTMREILKVDELLQEGMEQGIEQTKRESAKALLDLLDNKTIADRIGLTVQEVSKIREEYPLSQVH